MSDERHDSAAQEPAGFFPNRPIWTPEIERKAIVVADWVTCELEEGAAAKKTADDAKASWLRVTFDERDHQAHSLPSPSMAPLMGPALLLSSDQVFSPEDLDRIREVELLIEVRIVAPTETAVGDGFCAAVGEASPGISVVRAARRRAGL